MIFYLWERYFLKQLLQAMGLFLFTLYLLYTIMDYSLHLQDFIGDKSLSWTKIIIYYLCQFTKRADLLLPLALLIATIKVLTSANTHRELLSLQVSGVPLKKLLSPFLLIAVSCSLLNYLNGEKLLPQSLAYLDAFENTYFYRSLSASDKRVHLIHLEDHSKVLYRSCDKEVYYDLIWVRSPDDLWCVKFLYTNLSGTPPLGKYVDHLERKEQAAFTKVASYEEYPFPALKNLAYLKTQSPSPLENYSLSALYRLSHHPQGNLPYKKNELLTHFYFKSVMPLLSPLVVLAIAPFCVRYSRKSPLFLIYTLGIFGYIVFFTLMDACVILGENQVLSPFWAIGLPFGACAASATTHFIKTDKAIK